MLTFILRRVLSGMVLMAVVSTLSFFLLYAGSGDIARRILGRSASEAGVMQKAHELGLDKPIVVQYFDWVGHAVSGDLGSSWFTGQDVTTAITTRLAVTFSLVIGSTILTAVFAVVLGIAAARRRGWVDRVVQVVSLLGFAIPGFLIALALVIVLAINLQWFKPTGYVPFSQSLPGWISTVTLPIVALAVGGVAGVAQLVRSSVIDALRQDYVRTLRSHGLPIARVIYKHVLRNAGGPALAVLALQFIGMFGGAVIVEQIFAIPGLGQVSITATAQGDIPLVMGLVVVTAALVVTANLLIDLLQGWLNPKVRLS